MERIERGDRVQLLEDAHFDVLAGDYGVVLQVTPEDSEVVVKVNLGTSQPIVRVSPSTLRSF